MISYIKLCIDWKHTCNKESNYVMEQLQHIYTSNDAINTKY